MIPQSVIQKRLAQIMRELRSGHDSRAMLLGSASAAWRSRDQNHEFRQNSDFFYVTGSLAREALLLIKGAAKRPVVFVPKPDATKKLWDGSSGDFQALARGLDAELVVTNSPEQEILSQLKSVDLLYYQNEPGLESTAIAKKLWKLPAHRRGVLPNSFMHSDRILEPMRLIKEPFELKMITEAIKITCDSLRQVLGLVRPGVSESTLVHALEFNFKIRGGGLAFGSIVATGRSAATLHYEAYTRKLKRGDMLMFDIGADYNLYCSDLTRVFPVSGKFEGINREIYAMVLRAQEAALSEIRDGVKIRAVYDAAAYELTAGLRALRILKGTQSGLMKREAYKPYFPHGIGHPLGLDTHDVGNARGNNEARLRAGMVFTVEPGIYFAKPKGRVPACGVRIEDDVLVTKQGCKILTSAMPKDIDEVEKMMLRE